MQVVERTHHIDLIINSGSDAILPLIMEKFPHAHIIYSPDDNELEDATAASWFKETEEKLQAEPGRRLNAYRWRAGGMTQQQLAELCDLHTTSIGMIEIGRRMPSLSTLELIVKTLDIDYQDLFDFTNTKSYSNLSFLFI